jgi:hypothetical protein
MTEQADSIDANCDAMKAFGEAIRELVSDKFDITVTVTDNGVPTDTYGFTEYGIDVKELNETINLIRRRFSFLRFSGKTEFDDVFDSAKMLCRHLHRDNRASLERKTEIFTVLIVITATT